MLIPMTSAPADPFDRFIAWLTDLLRAIKARLDRVVARIVLTWTPGTGV